MLNLFVKINLGTTINVCFQIFIFYLFNFGGGISKIFHVQMLINSKTEKVAVLKKLNK